MEGLSILKRSISNETVQGTIRWAQLGLADFNWPLFCVYIMTSSMKAWANPKYPRLSPC